MPVSLLTDFERERLSGGYRRRMGGWRLDPARPFDNYKDLPESGWRRALSLWGATNVPFFRAFG